MEFIDFSVLSELHQKAVWGIYEDSFPHFEKRLFTDQQRAMADERFHPTGVMEDGQIVGMVFYWLFDQFAYIEHLAIAKNRRGQNYGTRILEQFCQQHPRVLLEIDPPIDEVSIKREHFYHRLGFHSTPFAYTHPSYRTENLPHTLSIMSYPDEINEENFQNFYKLMFNEIMAYSPKS